MTLTPENRWKKGKSVHKYIYTIRDISNLSGNAIQTVRNDICKGKLNMSDMKSICKYLRGKNVV